jgi:hypothetical protein
LFIPLLASSIIFEPSKSSPKSEYSPAIEKAINFFDDSHDPYALLFLDVIYRRFGVLEFKDSSQRFDQELPNNPLIEPTMKVFRRIVDNTNQPSSSDFYEAKQQGETNLIVIPALYCDRLGLPSNYSQMLEEATKKGEYYLTHVLLALIWVAENGYEEKIPQDFVKYVYDANTKLINSDDEVYDIELEAAARAHSLVIAPGERLDILVDFSGLAPGTKVVMRNSAATPYPNGDPTLPTDPTSEIMQFTCNKAKGYPAKTLPETLNPTLVGDYPTLPETSLNRTLPFFEEFEDDEPVGVFLNGQKWAGNITELPQVGTTEDWYLVNPTEDAHPIHTHLTQFQVLYRVPFNGAEYREDWEDLNGPVPVPLNVVPQTLDFAPYVTGPEEEPALNEIGWKDTIITPPGYVTVIRIRYAPQSAPISGPDEPTAGDNLFPFDPTIGPGYVWHCHILDHEDNEMMRPYEVQP